MSWIFNWQFNNQTFIQEEFTSITIYVENKENSAFFLPILILILTINI
jgi:hypothetical protein